LFLILNLLVGLLTRGLNSAGIPIGFEVVTLSTVLIGMTYGPLAGIIMGLTGRLMEAFSSSKYFSLIITLPLYALVGLIAGLFSSAGGNIVIIGIILSIAYALISGFLSFAALGGRASKAVIFAVTEIIVNVFLFANIAPAVLGIMA
jgi:hypothetical protein